MKIGIDYWQVLSHYEVYFCEYIRTMMNSGHHVYVISAIGKQRIGTIQQEVNDILGMNGLSAYKPEVIEVVFDSAKQSPELKLAKCLELGITVFHDDRDDVCRLLTKNGILALRVGRKDNSTYDLGAERK